MLIVLSGNINAGKSTVARVIEKMHGKIANIEIDDIRAFIEWMPILDCIDLNIKNGLDVARNFLDRGIDTIITYPLRYQDYDFILNYLEEYEEEIHFFTLCPPVDVNLVNRGTRELTEWEKGRIPELANEGIADPPFGTKIDNSQQTPEQTAEEILEKVGFFVPA